MNVARGDGVTGDCGCGCTDGSCGAPENPESGSTCKCAPDPHHPPPSFVGAPGIPEPLTRFDVAEQMRRRGYPLAMPQEAQDQADNPQAAENKRKAAIRVRFGSTVLINGDLVTKRYFMTGETGAVTRTSRPSVSRRAMKSRKLA